MIENFFLTLWGITSALAIVWFASQVIKIKGARHIYRDQRLQKDQISRHNAASRFHDNNIALSIRQSGSISEFDGIAVPKFILKRIRRRSKLDQLGNTPVKK